ncbi:hypothetical protein BC629DRAFT_447379 [Irpex lacteus]|nr:hypothetical protein BC629DRAFT_447379 [Irpex lacteus]
MPFIPVHCGCVPLSDALQSAHDCQPSLQEILSISLPCSPDRYLSVLFTTSIMGGAFEHLIMNTNTLVIGSAAERSLVRLQLREVFIRGLRERTLHNSSDVFVEISITGMNWVIKSPISSSPTSPSWPMGNLAGWFIPATSVLKFSVFRHHRVRPDELIAEVEGSAWTFLHNHAANN